MSSNETQNPVGLEGIEFIEFSTEKPEVLKKLFANFGLVPSAVHKAKAITLFEEQDIHWLVNNEPTGHAAQFRKAHGPSASAMGWRVKNARVAMEQAVARGARVCEHGDYFDTNGEPLPAIYGIGDSLIYFVENYANRACYRNLGFVNTTEYHEKSSKGFLTVDHLTNNVPNGTMEYWANFYKNIFGFTEVRYFDIRGKKTGLTSYALRSPCGTFCIPINEAKEEKSQINEYLREYNGAGIQHIALSTENIIESVAALRDDGVQMLDVEDIYYATVFNRVPNVKEDHDKLRSLGILIDGDDQGYLLQIFTQNMIGPIFFEIIQRKNNLSFGEGNFGALFRSIEKDQERRGVL